MRRTEARRLFHALNRIDEVYYMDAQNSGITETALCVMYALDDGRSHSQADICREWLIPKTTVNSLVKRWEKAGLIQQETAPDSRRGRALRFTDRGRKFAERHLSRIYRVEEAAMEKTAKRYGTGFIDVLEAFGENLTAELTKEYQTGL